MNTKSSSKFCYYLRIKAKDFFVSRKCKFVIILQQLYTGYKDFKRGKMKFIRL